MPEIRPTICGNGHMVCRDSAGHVMVTAPAGMHTPTPTMKVRTDF